MSGIPGSATGPHAEDTGEAVKGQSSHAFALIGPGEPAPFRVFNPKGRASALVVCDHASRRIPAALNNLGLDELALGRHIASDIGAAEVAERLAKRIDAPAVLAGYSRLVVDCNRQLQDPTSILAVSDGEFIPGNHGLSAEQKQERIRQFFDPYHDAIRRRIGSFERRGVTPALIAVHSFTPVFQETHRPWQVGILWDTDPRIPVPLMEGLAERGVVVGDNEPYSGKAPSDFTIDHHAEAAGLPHVSIEVRQDLVEQPEGARRWGQLLADVLQPILSNPELYSRLDEKGTT
ncbi:MAG: N-formylglutamate amidohydrolase [Gammaproteobacteria bacterium]